MFARSLKGKLFIISPSKNITAERLRSCKSNFDLDVPFCNRLVMESTAEKPIAKIKKGKTRSVGVHPFHAE
jgi:hypothetical protein